MVGRRPFDARLWSPPGGIPPGRVGPDGGRGRPTKGGTSPARLGAPSRFPGRAARSIRARMVPDPKCTRACGLWWQVYAGVRFRPACAQMYAHVWFTAAPPSSVRGRAPWRGQGWMCTRTYGFAFPAPACTRTSAWGASGARCTRTYGWGRLGARPHADVGWGLPPPVHARTRRLGVYVYVYIPPKTDRADRRHASLAGYPIGNIGIIITYY